VDAMEVAEVVDVFQAREVASVEPDATEVADPGMLERGEEMGEAKASDTLASAMDTLTSAMDTLTSTMAAPEPAVKTAAAPSEAEGEVERKPVNPARLRMSRDFWSAYESMQAVNSSTHAADLAKGTHLAPTRVAVDNKQAQDSAWGSTVAAWTAPPNAHKPRDAKERAEHRSRMLRQDFLAAFEAQNRAANGLEVPPQPPPPQVEESRKDCGTFSSITKFNKISPNLEPPLHDARANRNTWKRRRDASERAEKRSRTLTKDFWAAYKATEDGGAGRADSSNQGKEAPKASEKGTASNYDSPPSIQPNKFDSLRPLSYITPLNGEHASAQPSSVSKSNKYTQQAWKERSRDAGARADQRARKLKREFWSSYEQHILRRRGETA